MFARDYGWAVYVPDFGTVEKMIGDPAILRESRIEYFTFSQHSLLKCVQKKISLTF